MLEILGLTKRFGAHAAVDDVSLAIPEGQMVGVIGRSGAGKSTLLRLINRLTDPSEGSIRLNDTDVCGLRGAELLAWRARCAMVFQQFNLVPRLDVMTNVLIGRVAQVPYWRSLLQVWRPEDRLAAVSALSMFDMVGLAAQRAESLSGGQQQRVAICRALVQEPELVLADEPIASLDPRNAKIVMDALLRINKQFGITVITNLHSLDTARGYCDRLIGMAQGRIVFDGKPEALSNDMARKLYGMEAGEVMDTAGTAMPTDKRLPTEMIGATAGAA
jgi:phosphonate transport system ATP-binding protein